VKGDPVTDDSFLILFNGHHEPVEFRLPGTAIGEKWHVAVDSFQDGETRPELHAEDSVHIEARSTVGSEFKPETSATAQLGNDPAAPGVAAFASRAFPR
jgi:pullulanase/glycogen debranching enzyme